MATSYQFCRVVIRLTISSSFISLDLFLMHVQHAANIRTDAMFMLKALHYLILDFFSLLHRS